MGRKSQLCSLRGGTGGQATFPGAVGWLWRPGAAALLCHPAGGRWEPRGVREAGAPALVSSALSQRLESPGKQEGVLPCCPRSCARHSGPAENVPDPCPLLDSTLPDEVSRGHRGRAGIQAGGASPAPGSTVLARAQPPRGGGLWGGPHTDPGPAVP